ncbi:chloride channel CLIC-like protein 1 [Triplophysa dalaica]|uniref:chloride channel CLIC-like protein 1 n=1 Tax=Triplophysa dalaica TaxID=1582913 RepID=UPI0024DF9704|nr:chloride channel CLIC-like protein 1 [Triplophysa dalaica]
MRAPGCSSIGLWTLFVICGLFVIAYANIDNDDDEWNYDPTTKRIRKPTESTSNTNLPIKGKEFCSDSCEPPKCPDVSDCMNKLNVLQKDADEHKKKVVTTFQQPTCLPVFRRFLSKLLKESAKLGLPDDANKLMHYNAVVKLSKQSVSEINKLLREDNDWTTGAMDEALSQILVEFKHHDPEAWKWQFEDTFYVELDTVLKVLLCVLIINAVICTEVWSVVSWFIQIRRMFVICFFISLIWIWLHHMLVFAEHQKNVVQMESVNAKCTGVKQTDWKESLTEWFRHKWTPPDHLYEMNVVLMQSDAAASLSSSTTILSVQDIIEFLRALLTHLPLLIQIAVLLVIAGAIFVRVDGNVLNIFILGYFRINSILYLSNHTLAFFRSSCM